MSKLKFMMAVSASLLQRVKKVEHFQSRRSLRSLVSRRGHQNKEESKNASVENDGRKGDEERSKENSLEDLLESAANFQDKPETVNDLWSTSLYPVNVDKRRDQAQYAIRPKIDPKETSVILFPGQGVQFVGMGQNVLDYPNVKDMFEIASEILKYNLLDLCLQGPKEKLDKTVHCQPAVLVTSLAAVEKLKDEKPKAVEGCVATAGFSVGEISALVFAGALDFEDAVRLVKIRAEAMQAASEMTASGMMTVFLNTDAKINFACKAAAEWCVRKGIENGICSVANYLFPSCKVIAGKTEALEFIELNAKDLGIKKYKHLPVSGAFHTKLMKPAQKALEKALKMISVRDPLIPVYSNLDGKPYRTADQICKQLTEHICKPVKWEQTMHVIYERPEETSFPESYECGPGSSLRTILKMVNSKAWSSSFHVSV